MEIRQAINLYLTAKAYGDAEFKVKFENPNKNLDEDLKLDGTELSDVKVVSASATSFTDEEKAKMREEAIKKYQNDVIAEQKKKDNERKNKAKAKAKKPATPVLVPDTPSNDGEKPATKETKAEDKPKVVQMDLFG